jgi:amino acid adenylation domain-containing protein
MKPLHISIAEQAQKQPGALAIVSGNERVTYSALDDTANRIARLLISAGCERGDRIALLLPKSIGAIAGMLGSLKAGCIYVPMDTSSPVSRLEKILNACEPRCLLASATSADLVAPLLAERNSIRLGWLSFDQPKATVPHHVFTWADLASASGAAIDSRSSVDDAAHILFTSGSTGIPKGVVITHANIAHFLEWALPYFGTGPGQRISCQPPLHFDLSTFDVYGTLTAGAELYLVPPEAGLLPHKVADFIRRQELTQWFSVPSVLKYMCQFDVVRQGDFPSLQRLLWCGEALPTPVLIYLMRKLPHVTFTNLYGPTEATIASSYHTVRQCPMDDKSDIPIGVPCGGEQLIVLNESLGPVSTGEIGDLYIGGVGLSPGYWNDSEKTASVFFNDPIRGRIYKTGDLARTGEDGLLHLLGRADSQIKSRGYRIELGEIEAALSALGLLRESAVVAIRSGSFEGTSVCCAYVPSPQSSVTLVDLKTRLAELLPYYMIPAQWMAMESLPLNGNGKVDRPRLRQLFTEASGTAPQPQAGRPHDSGRVRATSSLSYCSAVSEE